MLPDNELENREKKYFDILQNVFSKNIAKILNESYSQNMQSFGVNGTANPIEHAIENIIEKIVAENLDWPICSVPISSDSCYECGDAIVYLDAKTVVDTDPDAIGEKVTVQAAQTSYNSSKAITLNRKKWLASVSHYTTHKVFGEVPNLTFVIKFIYEISTANNEYLIKKIQLISIPNGQLYHIFKKRIIGAGRNNNSGIYKSIRFLTNQISSVQKWRVFSLFSRQ